MSRRPTGRYLTFGTLALVLFILYRWSLPPAPYDANPFPQDVDAPPRLGEDDVELVVASMKRENTAWLSKNLLGWKKNIYMVDDPDAPLTVPVNKGREAMVFLTYVMPLQSPSSSLQSPVDTQT
jgi:hypothetical protein